MPDWHNYEHRKAHVPHWMHEHRIWDHCCGMPPKHKRVDRKYDVYCQSCGDSIIAEHAAEAMTKWNQHKRAQARKLQKNVRTRYTSLPPHTP